MTQVATVERILDNTHAMISVPRKSACGHDCAQCAGCGVTGTVVRARAQNPIGASVGDKVVVEGSTQKVLGIVLLVYLVPVILFLTGYIASAAVSSEGVRYVLAAFGFFLGLIPAILYDRRMRDSGGMTFTIVRQF